MGSDPNSARQFSICHKRIPELGSDPNSAGHAGGASVCVTHRSFGNATSHQHPSATKPGLADSVTCAHSVADLGSDPNSARDLETSGWCLPELGSDPNSAGHRCGAFLRFGLRMILASGAYGVCAGSYQSDSSQSSRSPPLTKLPASPDARVSPVWQHFDGHFVTARAEACLRRGLSMARRIGV